MSEFKNRFPLPFAAGALGLLALLGGCHVGPAYHAPTAPAITAPNYKESTVNFKDADGWKVASPQDAMIRGKWWEIFNEPELNALEEQLNVNNQTIKQYYQSYMQARAMIDQARAQLLPTVSTSPLWNRSRTSGNLRANSGSSSTTSTLWELPVTASWTPDFWNKIRNQVREQQYAAQASAADVELEKLALQSSLAQYFFEIRGQDMLQKILNQTVEADKKSLDYTQSQYDTGIGTYISVVEAKNTLQTAQSSAINVGLARAKYEHAIAVLLGKVPSDFSIPVKPTIYAAPAIPTGLPSQLVERRPDIAAAERTLAQNNALIGIGYGAYFPQVTISATGGLESALFKHLFDIPSRLWSVGPSVSQTIFNNHLYRAQIHQYEALYNANLASYRQTVLNSFQQVEDALAATRIYSQQIMQQQEAVKSAQEYLALEQERYQIGVDPYVNVVLAENTLLNSQQNLNALQVNEMLSAVQLVQALGGGWDVSQLPTPEQVSAKTTNADYQIEK